MQCHLERPLWLVEDAETNPATCPTCVASQVRPQVPRMPACGTLSHLHQTQRPVRTAFDVIRLLSSSTCDGSTLLHWRNQNFPQNAPPPLLSRFKLVNSFNQPLAWNQPTSRRSEEHHAGEEEEQFPPWRLHVNILLHSTLRHCLARQPHGASVETSHKWWEILHDNGSSFEHLSQVHFVQTLQPN